jgi:DNA-binding transcriptional LysR family regulator
VHDHGLIDRLTAKNQQRRIAIGLQGDFPALAVEQDELRLVTEDMVALRLAALRGVGTGQFPAFVVDNDLHTGRLIELLPGWTLRSGLIHSAFPSRRGLLPSIRALLDFFAKEYAVLGQHDGTRST